MSKFVCSLLYLVAFVAFGAGVILLKDISHAVGNPSEYNFGSIKMLAQHGNAYQSLSTYVNATLKTAGIFFFCSLLLSAFGSFFFVLKSTEK